MVSERKRISRQLGETLHHLPWEPWTTGSDYRVFWAQDPINLSLLIKDLAESAEIDVNELYETVTDVGEVVVTFLWYSDAPVSWSDWVVKLSFDDARAYVALSASDFRDDTIVLAVVEPANSIAGLHSVLKRVLTDGVHEVDAEFPGLGGLPTELSTVLPLQELFSIAVEAFDSADDSDPWTELLRDKEGRTSLDARSELSSESKRQLARWYLEGASRP